MKFKILYFVTFLTFTAIQSLAFATASDSASELNANDEDNDSSTNNFNAEYSDQYFYGEDEALTESELNALKITSNWKINHHKLSLLSVLMALCNLSLAVNQ